MMRWLSYGLLASCLLGLNVAAAGELEELRERAAALATKARALNERGEKAEAEAVVRELFEVTSQIRRLEVGNKEESANLGPRANELRDRAAELKKKAAALIENGNKLDSQRLFLEAGELTHAAQKIEQRLKDQRAQEAKQATPAIVREVELQRLHARVKELQVAHRELWASDAPDEELVDIRNHIRKLEEHIAAKFGHARPQPGSSPEALKHVEGLLQRIDHLRAAAQHLQAADMPEMAHELRARSNDIENKARMLMDQFEQQSKTLPPAPPPAKKERAVEQALRQEIEGLRKELDALRKQRQP